MFGVDDMDYALFARWNVKESYAVFKAVLAEFRKHFIPARIGVRLRYVVGWNDVVNRRERAVRVLDFKPQSAHHSEGLRACHFVQKVRADEKLG